MSTQTKPRVLFCALPKRGAGVGVYEAAIAHYLPSLDGSIFQKVIRGTVESSILTHGFNRMWCAAMTMRESEGVTHFAMIHDDICAPVGWADCLVTEMENAKADMISAVVPIKDKRGITSTGIETGDSFSPGRLTMTEVYDGRPETFTYPGILINTALMVVDIRVPWADKVLFRQQDQIVVTADGHFVARTNPEDWDFSRQWRMHGGTLYATRKVPVFHQRAEYHNKSAWGEWEKDRGETVPDPRKAAPSRAPAPAIPCADKDTESLREGCGAVGSGGPP